jgi:hypothetical protein
MLDLKIIIGSTRPGRAVDKVMPWISSASRTALQQARSRGTLPPAIMRLMAAREGSGK